MRASVHGYTRGWKQTGTTGRLASTAARLPPAESPPTARSGAQPSSAAARGPGGDGGGVVDGGRVRVLGRQPVVDASTRSRPVGERPARSSWLSRSPNTHPPPWNHSSRPAERVDGRPVEAARHPAGVDVADRGDRLRARVQHRPALLAGVCRGHLLEGRQAERREPGEQLGGLAVQCHDAPRSCPHSDIHRCAACAPEQQDAAAREEDLGGDTDGTPNVPVRSASQPPIAGPSIWPTAKAVVITAIARVGSAGCIRPARSTPTPVIPANVAPRRVAPISTPAVPGTNAADSTPAACSTWATTRARARP